MPRASVYGVLLTLREFADVVRKDFDVELLAHIHSKLHVMYDDMVKDLANNCGNYTYNDAVEILETYNHWHIFINDRTYTLYMIADPEDQWVAVLGTQVHEMRALLNDVVTSVKPSHTVSLQPCTASVQDVDDTLNTFHCKPRTMLVEW